MFTALPSTITGWAALLTIVLVGIFAVVGTFDRVRKQREDESNKVDDRLIGLLKDQIEALEKRVSAQEKELAETKAMLQSLQSENKILRDVLQGKDTTLMEYMADGRKTMKDVSAILKKTEENGKNIERLYKVIEKHLANLETHG